MHIDIKLLFSGITKRYKIYLHFGNDSINFLPCVLKHAAYRMYQNTDINIINLLLIVSPQNNKYGLDWNMIWTHKWLSSCLALLHFNPGILSLWSGFKVLILQRIVHWSFLSIQAHARQPAIEPYLEG